MTRSGWIVDRGDRGRRWQARYRGPDGRTHSRSFARKVDAQRWLSDELGKLDRGLWVDPSAGAVTFGEWSAGWFAGKQGLKPATVASYRSLLDSRVLPVFGSVEVRRITPAMVRDWIAVMTSEGVSASRIGQARHVLRSVLDDAVTDGLIGRNPVVGTRAPTARSREPRYLTDSEVDELAEAADSRQEGSGLVVLTLAWVGLRWGELAALRRSRVDVLRRRITVAESATEIRGHIVFGTTKTHTSRVVTLPVFVAELIAPHLAGGDGLVFTGPRGGTLRGSDWRRRVWHPAVADAGIQPGLRPHDLRHTAASLMISSGASIKAVQRQLGHANASMSLDLYGHLYDDDLDALGVALDKRRAAAPPPRTGDLSETVRPLRRKGSR